MANFLNKIKRKSIRAEAKWGCQQKGSFSEEKNDELTYPIPGARCIGCPRGCCKGGKDDSFCFGQEGCDTLF